jgi:hypothetical protein
MLPAPASAGDRDSHLTATHFIARLLGFNEREARLIAAADYSIDINDSTQPLPIWSRQLNPISAKNENLQRMMRDTVVHSLNDSPEAALAQLERLKASVEKASGDERLRYAGQYLHALQDAYFHQYLAYTSKGPDPEPYDKVRGHVLPTKHLGGEVDGVATHFDGALRAFLATRRTLEALRASWPNETVTLPDPRRLGIYEPTEPDLAYLAHIHSDMILLAGAIAHSYRDGAVVPQYDQLDVNLKRLWATLAPTSERPLNPAYDPLLKLNGEESVGGRIVRDGADKVDYDNDPTLLMDSIRDPLHLTSDGQIQAPAGIAPGGISLSGAAAIGMPIEIDVDAIQYDATNNSIVLSGRGTSEPQVFDAAIFLTALRLGCSKTDPYFSLDPPDWSIYPDQLSHALADLDTYANELANQLLSGGVTTSSPTMTNGVELRGPVIVGLSMFERDQARYRAMLSRYPALRPRLVFKPEWLRETRLGKILYDADVVLKEFSEGLGALNPGQQAAVGNVAGYVSSRQRKLANALRFQLGLGRLEESNYVHTWRMWLDLAETGDGFSPQPSYRNPEPTPELLARAAGAANIRLINEGLIAFSSGPANVRPVEIIDSNSIRDLSMIVPRMFTRGQEDGRDISGYDPDLRRVANDVNDRFWTYAEQYPELRRLVQVFRAYVAGRKIAEAAPSFCTGLDVSKFPLLPAERILEALPMVHPYPLLSVQIGLLKVTSADSRWMTRFQYVTGYAGGVSISYDSVKRIETTNSTLVAQEVEALLGRKPPDAILWRSSTQNTDRLRTALAIALDVAGDASNFRPITAEHYLAGVDAQLDQILKKLPLPSGKDDNGRSGYANDERGLLEALKSAILQIRQDRSLP